jgi:outer membrane protein TolC/ABC-type uncharacterized transport system substrate-binding protein
MLQLEGVMRRETICLLLMLTLGLGLVAFAQEPETLTIAILRDGDSPYFDEIGKMLQSELEVLTADEWLLTFLKGPDWTANWDPDRAKTLLEKAFQDPQVDGVYAGGMLITKAVLAYGGPLPKPVVSGFIEDPSTIGLPISADGFSTIPNYTFVVVPCEAAEDITLFRQIVPFNNLAVLVDEYYLLHNPDVKRQAEEYKAATGLQIQLVPMTASAGQSLAAIPGDAQAVYLTPSVVMAGEETQKLIDGIKARKLPSFSMMGLVDVRRGIMAGQQSEDSRRIIRRLALNIQQILMGAAPETLPVLLETTTRVVLNAATAREIGVALPYRIMQNADILHPEEVERGKPLDLRTAYELALANNPAVAAGAEEVNQAREDRFLARSALFPRLNANLQYAEVDEDRAVSSMGLQPQKTTQGGVSITQIVFNDPAITTFRARSLAYRSRQFEQAGRELDTLEQVANAYINLLSRKALLQIELRNLNQIQTYLDFARNRERSGVAGPEEIYRWEAQLAGARSSMMDAFTQVSIAQTLLNQAMGGSMDDLWSPADSAELIKYSRFFDPAYSEMIQNDRQFDALRSFLLEKAMDNAPELQALDFAIQAQQVVANQYRRRFVVPEVGVSFNFDHTFSKTLAASDPASPPPFIPPEGKDDTWLFAAVASWPLFEGGGKVADLRKAQAEIRRLQELRRQTEQYIRQRVYEALLASSSSDSTINLTQRAADLAGKSLDVVQQKYARGKVAIVELLDAQTDAFVKDQQAVLAKYQFMLDVIKAQRAVAWFPEMQDMETRHRWFSDLEQTVQQSTEVIP